MAKARLESHFYTHEELWYHALSLYTLSKSDESHEQSLGLAALSLLFFAFEGYLNFCIESAFPDVWKEDKDFFRRPPYKGTLGKLAYIRTQLKIQVDKGNRANHTLKRLRRWRHTIVHPKIERRSKEVHFTDPRRLKNLESEFLKEVNSKFIETAFQDVRQTCDEIQSTAFDQRRRGFNGPSAFSGVLGAMGGELLK